MKKNKDAKIDHKNLFGLTLASDALEDYIAARILMKEDRYASSIQLATTAVEKIFKSFINLVGEVRIEEKIHRPSKLFLQSKELFQKHDLLFREDFLKWLDDVYETRYSSNMYPKKEINFGKNLFLIALDEIFFCMFSFYKSANEELGRIFFKNIALDKIADDNYYFSNEDLDDWLDKSQKLVKLFFIDGRVTIAEIDMVIYDPESPFNIKPLIIENGILPIEIDVGSRIEVIQTDEGTKIVRKRD